VTTLPDDSIGRGNVITAATNYTAPLFLFLRAGKTLRLHLIQPVIAPVLFFD